jgi:hypothetical protein
MAIEIDVCRSVLHSAREERPLSAFEQIVNGKSYFIRLFFSIPSIPLEQTYISPQHPAADTHVDFFCSQPDK